MKKIISYSAPGKVILSGEHAVVYGKPAIVAAINMRLTFKIWESKNSDNSDKNILLTISIIKNYLKKNKISFIDKLFDYHIESQIPIQQRLGSSAAYSVAGIASFLDFYTGWEWNKEIINNLHSKDRVPLDDEGCAHLTLRSDMRA